MTRRGPHHLSASFSPAVECSRVINTMSPSKKIGKLPREKSSRAQFCAACSVACNTECVSNTSLFNNYLFIAHSIWMCLTVIGLELWFRRNVDIGAVVSMSVKALMGDILPLCGDGALCSPLSMPVYSSGGRFSSETIARNVQRNSFTSLSTDTLLNRLYGSVKWCGTFTTLDTTRTVPFFKFVGPLEISAFGTHKASD